MNTIQTPLQFRVWDIDNKCFLNEFQGDDGRWLWGSKTHATWVSWKWILEHPEWFVVDIFTNILAEGDKKIFTGDILECEDANLQAREFGVIVFTGPRIILKGEHGGNEYWEAYDRIIIKGNVHENPEMVSTGLLS